MRDVLAAAGSLRDNYAAVDWDSTSLGPVGGWSPTLKMAVTTALQTRFPVTLLWGPEYVMLYNEAYVPMIGDKHPAALGRAARDVFPEIWDTIGPMLDSVAGGAGATWVTDLRLLMNRYGYLEETYFTFSYSAVTNDTGGIEGVIDIASETTEQVISNRRLRLLHRLTEELNTITEPRELLARALPVLRDADDDFTAVDLYVPGLTDAVTPTPDLVQEPLAGMGGVLAVRPSPYLGDDGSFRVFLRLVAASLTQALDRTRARQAERRLARMERELSETLQRSLLTPPRQPDHLSVAVRYQSALAQSHIGGDWYDSFLTPDGILTLAVGDVTGHDRHAAAAMAQLRNLLRGIAVSVRRPPSRIIGGLDEAMSTLEVSAMATAIVAQIERDPSGVRVLRWSNAGHPPPVLLHPDGSVELLSAPPVRLLGTGLHRRRDDHTVTLMPGSMVVLYTDGLIERRAVGLDDSLKQLIEALTGRHRLGAEQLCDHLLDTFGSSADDDIVLLVVRAGQ